MPWRQMPMKDVGHCDKSRGAVYRLDPEFPNEETHSSELEYPPAEHIGWRKGTQGTETSKYR